MSLGGHRRRCSCRCQPKLNCSSPKMFQTVARLIGFASNFGRPQRAVCVFLQIDYNLGSLSIMFLVLWRGRHNLFSCRRRWRPRRPHNSSRWPELIAATFYTNSEVASRPARCSSWAPTPTDQPSPATDRRLVGTMRRTEVQRTSSVSPPPPRPPPPQIISALCSGQVCFVF